MTTPELGNRRHAIIFTEPTLTRGSFKDECDVNKIVETYVRTGMVNHVPRHEPQFGDAPDVDFYTAACAQAAIRSVQEQEALGPPPEEPEALASDEPLEGSQEPPEAPEATPDAGTAIGVA